MITVLKSFFSTWAIMRIGNIHSMNIFSLILFFPILSFYTHNSINLNRFYSSVTSDVTSNTCHKSVNPFLLLTGTFSGLFTLFYLLGSYPYITSDVDSPLFKIFLVVVTAMGLFFLIQEVLYFLNYILYSSTSFFSVKYVISNFEKKIEKHARKLPFICFFICIFSRIPYFLYSYPGIMTPDSINQLEQVLGMKPFSNHHPWIHTMIISLFYHLGCLFTDNQNLAFSFYTVFQIGFMALSASYLIYVLTKYNVSKFLLTIIILFYALMPYHNVMAICIWKDVLFSGTVLIFSTALFDLVGIQSQKIKTNTKLILRENKASFLIYFLSGIFFCLLRSNGWYAFLLTIPFLIMLFWKNRKIMLPLHFFILFTVVLIKGPIMEYYQVRQPDFVESLSIPLQQVGRVIAKGNILYPEEQAFIDQIMESQYVPELYKEYISDPMKELVRAGNPIYLEEHKKDFFQLWLTLGLRYPQTYLEAYVEQTKGFYSPATIYSVAEVDGIIDNDTGVSREYLLRGKPVVKIREILIKLHEIIPLYGIFWSMGSLFWSLLLLLYLQLSKCCCFPNFLENTSEYHSPNLSFSQSLVLWLPSIAIIGTLLLATPVATEFRYAYHLAYCLPLYVGILFVEVNYKKYTLGGNYFENIKK